MDKKREDYNEVLGEQQFECICENCSKPFIGLDEEATLCPECWSIIMEEIAKQQNN